MEEATECLNGINLKNHTNSPTLTFKNITCRVTRKKKNDTFILKDASGTFRSGRLTAILGPSGAGKTTLLKILAGYKSKGVTGHVLLDGKDRTDEDRWKSCCISQEPALLTALSTRETLSVAAELKIATKVSAKEKEKVILDIAELLNLQKAMDTRVLKLSGGELKRLSVGVELVSDPPIMFFDEPTSGLDSVSSVQIITHLETLARNGRTIVCVIHQPSSKIFDMFDDMILVSNGRIIYGGPISELVSTFRLAGFVCPEYYNRADFALEVASLERENQRNLDLLEKKAKTSDSDSGLSTTMEDTVSDNRDVKVGSNGSTNLTTNTLHRFEDDSKGNDVQVYVETVEELNVPHKCDYAVSGWKQFGVLFKRSFRCTMRDMQLAYLRIGAQFFVAISLGLVYYQIGNEATKIYSNSAFLFFILLFIYFSNCMPTILTFPLEAAVFQRESLNHWYSTPAYYFSKILADLLLQFLGPSIFLSISYFMTNQPSDLWRFSMVWIVCIIFTIFSQGCGLLTGVLFKPVMGFFILPSLTIPMLMFSGFFIRYDELPAYMSGLSYISHFGYGFEAIVQVIYGYDREKLHCSEDYCYLMNPAKFLNNIKPRMSYQCDVLILLTMMFTLHFFLYVALHIRIKLARN